MTSMTTVVETQRMRLRQYRHDDLDDLAAMFADEETMRYYPRPKTRDEALAWIEWNLGLYAEKGFGLWVMESKASSEFLGDCGLTPQTVEGVADIEVGWHTKKAFWKQGFATEAAPACRDLGFNNFGLRRMISIIDPENIPSRRVAEKIGMRPERTAIHGGIPQVIYAIDDPLPKCERVTHRRRKRWELRASRPTVELPSSVLIEAPSLMVLLQHPQLASGPALLTQ